MIDRDRCSATELLYWHGPLAIDAIGISMSIDEGTSHAGQVHLCISEPADVDARDVGMWAVLMSLLYPVPAPTPTTFPFG